MKPPLHKVINNVVSKSQFTVAVFSGKISNHFKRICVYFSFFIDTSKIPKITTKAPNNCNKVSLSFKKMPAKTMVEIGPKPAITAKFDEVMRFMDSETKKDGITVAKIAMRKPNTYTSQGKLKRLIFENNP